MEFQVLKNPLSMVEIQMKKDEMIRADSGSFVYSHGNIEIKTRMRKGFLKNLKIKFLGGESFFVNDFVAKSDSKLGLSGPPIGDIIIIPITNDGGFIIQSGSYIASTKGVVLDTKWQGFTKGIFGSELFMLKATGQGVVVVNAYGGIIRRELKAGEKMDLDNYHLIALSKSAKYKVTKFGGIKSTILGGEGLLIKITGPGIVYFQTKNLKELVDILSNLTRPETSSAYHYGTTMSAIGLASRLLR